MSNRTVYKHPDGWADKDNDASRPAKVYSTQREAEEAAREHLRNNGGGELTIQGTDGQFRQKDTVPPGHDPYPPKG